MSTPSFLIRAFRSIQLDVRWIAMPNIPEKWRFLLTKYLFILAPKFFWNKKIKAFGIPGWGRITYITNVDRIAHLQSIFIDHAHLQALIPKGGVIVDVGAHIGEFALFARTCLSPKKIYSFEPVPRSFELLQQNNQDVHFNIAICNEEKIEIYIDEQSGMSSRFKQPTTIGSITTQCKPIDAVDEINELTSIDLLKIDVEGMEYDVIACSPNTVRKSKYIVVETTLDRGSSDNGLSTLSLLKHIKPHMELIRIGHIIKYADTGKQAAVDLVFGDTIE